MEYRSEITRNYYFTTAIRGGERNTASKERYFKFLKHKIGEWLPKDKNLPLLDLACGCGEVMLFLKDQGYSNLHGIDLCEKEVEICRSFGLLNVQRGDIRASVKGYQEKFQLITCFNILEHLEKGEAVGVLQDIYVALRKGGCLIVLAPNAGSPLGIQTRYWDFTHELAFSTNSWSQLASFIGFEPPLFREFSPYPHGFLSLIRFVLWQIFRLGIKFYNFVETASTRGGVYSQDMFVLLKKPV